MSVPAGSVFEKMLRAVFVSAVLVGVAGPALADDMDTCRDQQTEAKARLNACENVIAAAQVPGKDLAIAYGVRGQAFRLKRNYDKAIAAFEAAHAADSDNPNYINGRGLAYEGKGDDAHAMADYNLVLQMRANSPLALNNRGTLYLRQGAIQSALDDFNAAVNLNPNLYLARVNRGHVLTINKDYDGALKDFAEAERIDPAAAGARALRCLTYTAMGQFDKALADCNAVLEKMPKNQYTLASRGEVYLAKGDLDAALKDFNFVLSLNPNHVRGHEGRGELFERKHNPEQARADYRSASFALTPFDNYEVAAARQKARERLAALTPQAPSGAATTRRVALVIGNGAYKNVPQLANPPRDAKLIADSLRAVGFQEVTLANDLTRDGFFDTLRAFARDAEKADWAVMYYAGHGLEIGGVNYLVPVDARLAVDKDAETEAVALEQAIAAVGAARKLHLVMLDACRDNPFAPAMQRTIALKLVDKGLSDIEPSAGFMVVYAAKHGETALDGEGVDSPFAVALARDVKEPYVEVRKLFDIIRDDVWNSTRHEQQPFIYGSPPGREDFYFVAGK
jgi:tetratricopeptide (TPR) repeat protein